MRRPAIPTQSESCSLGCSLALASLFVAHTSVSQAVLSISVLAVICLLSLSLGLRLLHGLSTKPHSDNVLPNDHVSERSFRSAKLWWFKAGTGRDEIGDQRVGLSPRKHQV
jgi:hypothetical protein